MLQVLRKSKQVSVIVLDRIGDYLALARIELKIQSHDFFIRVVSYSAAALCAIFTIFFFAVAILISFWDTTYRIIAAWSVVILFIIASAAGIALARKHGRKYNGLSYLREELKRDAQLLRESL